MSLIGVVERLRRCLGHTDPILGVSVRGDYVTAAFDRGNRADLVGTRTGPDGMEVISVIRIDGLDVPLLRALLDVAERQRRSEADRGEA